MANSPATTIPASVNGGPKLPGQVVLVMQGGGALGAYQGGVYEALHEAGIEPNWVIGTSIGALNAGLIAGNKLERRLDRLKEFWATMEFKPWWRDALTPWFGTRASSTIGPTRPPTPWRCSAASPATTRSIMR